MASTSSPRLSQSGKEFAGFGSLLLFRGGGGGDKDIPVWPDGCLGPDWGGKSPAPDARGGEGLALVRLKKRVPIRGC